MRSLVAVSTNDDLGIVGVFANWSRGTRISEIGILGAGTRFEKSLLRRQPLAFDVQPGDDAVKKHVGGCIVGIGGKGFRAI